MAYSLVPHWDFMEDLSRSDVSWRCPVWARLWAGSATFDMPTTYDNGLGAAIPAPELMLLLNGTAMVLFGIDQARLAWSAGKQPLGPAEGAVLFREPAPRVLRGMAVITFDRPETAAPQTEFVVQLGEAPTVIRVGQPVHCSLGAIVASAIGRAS